MYDYASAIIELYVVLNSTLYNMIEYDSAHFFVGIHYHISHILKPTEAHNKSDFLELSITKVL